MKNEVSSDMIWNLTSLLRDVVYSRNLAFSALRLLFLKYALDNYIGATSKEDMQQCVRAQKMFALRDISNGIETVIPVMQYIDRAYGLDGVLSSHDNIDEYARELFGADRFRQKRNASEDGFRSLMEFVGGLDLEEGNEPVIGRKLVEAIISMNDRSYSRNSFSGENASDIVLSSLAKELLHVTSEDVFLDFASGVGVSTLFIAGDAQPQIVNVELSGANAAAAAMLYIMYGYQNIRILVGDSISQLVPGLSGNKVFVDPPIASRVEKSDTNIYTDSSLAVLYRVMHDYLTKDGDALVVLPANPLFQGKKQAVDLRKELVQRGMLKAVIGLPPMWYATTINTHLLLITKEEMIQPEVLFIDAAKEMKNTKIRGSQASTIPADLIKRIASTVADRDVIEGFSCLASLDEIRNNNYNLVPATYLASPGEEDSMTMEEVEAQLAELYRQLME